MLKNYFKTAYRDLWRDKISSAISISGLAVGMACCMLILTHINDELGYNTFNVNSLHIYRINWITNDKGRANVESSTPVPFSKLLAFRIPGIRRVAKLYQRSGEIASGMNGKNSAGALKRFQEQGAFFTDQDIFKIFTIPFIAGDQNSALASPNSIVISQEMARKYFGSTDPLGQTLIYDNKVPLRVNGVVKKMPCNSDLQFDFLISFETLYSVEAPAFADFIKNDWTFNPCDTWILLNAEQLPLQVEQSLNQYLRQNGSVRNHQLNRVELQPLNAIHLYASNVIGNASSSDITYIYVFGGIAFLILVIANVNFINLSIARSINRIKEVGVRKVLGAGKKQLVLQFLVVALLTSFAGFLAACLITEWALPALNLLTNKQLSWNSWITLPNMVLFGTIFFITGILAGVYPAIFVTRLKMTLALMGKTGDQTKRNLIQKALLIVQFTISIVLIIGTGIIYQQLQYLRNKPLGFQKQQMLVVPIFGTGAFSFGLKVDSSMRRRMNSFSDELSRYHKIEAVTACSEMPGQGLVRGLVVPEGYGEQDNIFIPWLSVDYNFVQTMHLQLLAGRNFSKTNGSDFRNAFIINESAVRAFGWKTPGNAIGKTFTRGKLSDGKKGQVIGVVRDFDFNSLNNPMEALVMDVSPTRFTEFAIRIKRFQYNQTIRYVRQIWDEIFPERVFEYSFLDKNIDNQYKDKENFSRMIEYFAFAAILLSCSGLFGLAFFLAAQRTREIGIRKVLGAEVKAIVWLLSVDFIKLVALAAIIASPVAWWLMHRWLQGFAYHVGIECWIFIAAALIAVLIAFVTLSFQTIRAALSNPVQSLKSE